MWPPGSRLKWRSRGWSFCFCAQEDQRKKKTPFYQGGCVPQMRDPGAFLTEKNQGFTGGAADGNEVRSPSSATALGGRSNSPRTERRIRCLRMKMLHQAIGRYLVSTQFFGEAFSLAFCFGGNRNAIRRGRRKHPALNAAHSGGFRLRENVQMSLIQNGRGERI